jgi:hypothetical protein
LKAKKDAPLMLRAAGRDRQSGLATVGVFIGKPTPDGALPAGVTPTPATPTPGDRTSWTATVPLTGERRGPTDFTVVFTNNVGLSSFATTTIDLVDSLPPATGAIAGRVSEGALGQPDLGVQLVGPDGKEKAKTKTDAKGGYRFNGLAPGAYKVVAAKIETDRKASLDVTVEAGKTTPADLDLFK